MNAAAMNPGDIVYSVHGQAAEFVARSFDGYIVRQLFTREDGEPHVGKPEIWHEVFATPPVAKVHEKIAAAEKRLQELNAAITAARDQQRELDATEKDRLARLKQHEALARIDDFLAGKITHYVVESWSGFVILDTAKAISGDEDSHSYNKETKLLTLFGKSNGDLQWCLNRYSDGSGQWSAVWPCTSYGDAVRVATTRIEEEYAKWRGGDTRARLSDAAKAAAALQMLVPDDVRAHLKATAVANAKAGVEQRQKELATAQAKLDEAEAT
ncbi:MAG: hypothetical protein JWM53_5868 [bacterium]|nr:hypothetical protein [bacterium]